MLEIEGGEIVTKIKNQEQEQQPIWQPMLQIQHTGKQIRPPDHQQKLEKTKENAEEAA